MTSCKAGQRGADTVKKLADDFARNNLPLIKSLISEGNSYRDVASILNDRGITSSRGANGTPQQYLIF